jgi:hypothetical protein
MIRAWAKANPRLEKPKVKTRRASRRGAGGGCRAGGSPGALFCARLKMPEHGAKNLFAPTARRREPFHQPQSRESFNRPPIRQVFLPFNSPTIFRKNPGVVANWFF